MTRFRAKNIPVRLLMLAGLGVLVTAPATAGEKQATTQKAPPAEGEAQGTYDPLEPINRITSGFNSVVRGALVDPLVDGYKAVTPKEMQELVEWTQASFLEKKIHPLLITANFIVEFLQIHPFQDGNGRISRILTNLLLLKTGYLYMPYVSHEKLIEDNKPDYYMEQFTSVRTGLAKLLVRNGLGLDAL